MPDCVTLPPQPVKARYATPSEPTAREGSAAQYAGGPSTIIAGPKYGAAGGAPAGGPGEAPQGTANNGRDAPPIIRRAARPRTTGARTRLLPSRGEHGGRRDRQRVVRFERAEGQPPRRSNEAGHYHLPPAEVRSEPSLSGGVRDRRVHWHREVAPLRRSAGGGSEGQVGSAHPHGKDGPDDRPDGRLLLEGRRKSVHQLDGHRPLRRLPAKGNR